jgi:hypothetical protein
MQGVVHNITVVTVYYTSQLQLWPHDCQHRDRALTVKVVPIEAKT